MTKRSRRETDEVRKLRVQALLDEWVSLMGLLHYGLSWELVDDLDDGASANILYQEHYRTAHLKFTRRDIDLRPSDLELAALVTHELAHLILQPIRDAIGSEVGFDARVGQITREASEQVCDHISSAVTRAQTGGHGPIYSPTPSIKEAHGTNDD